MFPKVLQDVEKDLHHYLNNRTRFSDYVSCRLEDSLEQYTKELASALESLSLKNNINVLKRYSGGK